MKSAAVIASGFQIFGGRKTLSGHQRVYTQNTRLSIIFNSESACFADELMVTLSIADQSATK
jgi:hypothetical protein